MYYRYIFSIIVMSFPLLYSQTTLIKLPEDFCSIESIIGNSTCIPNSIITTDEKNPVIVILIHGTFSNADSFLNDIIVKDYPIPEDIFEHEKISSSRPIRLTFSWTGKNSDKARIEGGKKLAQGINDIIAQFKKESIEPKIILIAHSHGGNVIAVASNSVDKPIDIAIFLATPVLRHNQAVKSGTENDLYLPKKISTLFLFYSMNDMIQTIGAIQEKLKRRYGPIDSINLYNVRLLVNGQEPLHLDLYNRLIDDNILGLCSDILSSYKKNKNLVANLAPGNTAANKLIAIKKYELKPTSLITGESTDALWPNWEEFTYSENEMDEIKKSETARATFKTIYNVDFLDTASLFNRTVLASQIAFCTNAAGKLGSALRFMPKENRESIAEVCCPIAQFRNIHPNATTALNCVAHNNHLSTDNIFSAAICVNGIGPAGSLLYGLDEQTKKILGERCCSKEFKNKHPNAAKALSCDI